MSENYFTFPLAVLNGADSSDDECDTAAAPLRSLELALHCGVHGAGKGFRHRHGHEAFKERLGAICDELHIGNSGRPGPCTARSEVLVGAHTCNVRLGSYEASQLDRIAAAANLVPTGGPLVRMKADFFWAAFHQARAEADPEAPWPERGISWREFRVLCAILSVKTNRAGFAFIGWETIRVRACGFAGKTAFRTAEMIPDHLAPPLSHKQVRNTTDAMEACGFYARFRLATGPKGGRLAYSFRHTHDELARVVCDSINFKDRVTVRKNRAADAEKCLELLERAKLGQCWDKEGGIG
jgi:hypothetical protein